MSGFLRTESRKKKGPWWMFAEGEDIYER